MRDSSLLNPAISIPYTPYLPFVSFTGIPTELNGGNHTRAFAAAARTTEAHEACFNVAKALAAVGVRVLTDDVYLGHVCIA